MAPGSHVTLATSTGILWLVLLVHALAGTAALIAGATAVVAAKGGRLHRRAGMVFVGAMIVMGVWGAVVAAYELKLTAIGGILSVYLVLTGLMTVRPVASTDRTPRLALVLMVVAALVALAELTIGFVALGRPRATVNGVPAGMIFFMGTIALLAAIGDWRMIRGGIRSVRGTRKLARHLWRMCFALFIASGSFFLGQMKFVPAPLRVLPLLLALGLAPLLVLVYWMWRVRLRHSLRGMIVSNAHEIAGRA